MSISVCSFHKRKGKHCIVEQKGTDKTPVPLLFLALPPLQIQSRFENVPEGGGSVLSSGDCRLGRGHPPGREPGGSLAPVAQPGQTQLLGSPDRRLEEVRGVVGVRAPEVPHGPRPHLQHHRPRHLVRHVAETPEGDHPRLHRVHLRRRREAPVRRGVVEHRTQVHRPDRREHLRHRPPWERAERPFLLSRQEPHSTIGTLPQPK